MTHSNGKITYIDETDITNKTVLLRVDFNVSLTDNLSIADDARIKQSLPTIQYLLQNNNKLILISHLDRPKKRDPKFSLIQVAKHLQTLINNSRTVTLIKDFTQDHDKERIRKQKPNEIILLENIRFYHEEKNNDPEFAKKLANLADIYVNDAFGVSHRADTSVVGIPPLLPSYGGLLLKKEIEMISKAIEKPQDPVVAILGGAKISTKINLIGRLMEIADYVLVGGGIANTFLSSQEYKIGQSFCEYEEIENARRLLFSAAQKHTAIILPSDAAVGYGEGNPHNGEIRKIGDIPPAASILDIGPETKAKFGSIISRAKTIIWNGPVGLFENPPFNRGTDFVYYSITHNPDAISIVGGGETIAAISKKEYLDNITHISTGGGAMLEFIEKGTLPGIEALKK